MSNLVTREQPATAIARDVFRPLSIFEEMDRLSREIQQRAFSLFEERGGFHGFDLDDWFRAEAELVHPMAMDIEEEEKELVVRAEVPGFDVKELTVSVDPHHIRVYGKSEKKEPEPRKEGVKKLALRHRREISTNEVLREIALPAAIDPEKVTARLDKGVLEIRLPKAAPPRLIEIKPAA